MAMYVPIFPDEVLTANSAISAREIMMRERREYERRWQRMREQQGYPDTPPPAPLQKVYKEPNSQEEKHKCSAAPCKEEETDFYEGIITYHKLLHPNVVEKHSKICKKSTCLLARIKNDIK